MKNNYLKSITISMALLFGIIAVTAHNTYPVSAQTPTKIAPTAVPTTKVTPDTIDILKEKIEEKVDQLNKSNKKVVAGTVSKVTDDQLELKSEGKTYTVTLDSTVTKVFSGGLGSNDELEIEDIEKDDYLVVSGPSIDEQVSANIIYVQTQYIMGIGQITNVDSGEFTIEVLSQEKDQITLDIDKNTSQKIIDTATLDIETGGFTKYKVGDTLHYAMSNYDEDKKFGTAVKTLILPQEFFTEDEEEVATPSPTKKPQ